MKTAHRNAAKAKRRVQADPASLYRVMARIQLYTPAEQAKIVLPALVAFESIRTGTGTEHDLDTLAIATNTTLILSEKVHQVCIDVVQRGIDAILAMKARLRRTGRVIFSNLNQPEMLDIVSVIELYEEFLKHITPAQHKAALSEVLGRIKSGDFLEAA